MTHETNRQPNARADDSLDAKYRELMTLAKPDGCKCGIPGCPGHEVVGGRIFMENHPLGPIIIDVDRSPGADSKKPPKT